MKEINWIELMFRTLEGKASSSAQATGFEGDLCFAKILLLESFCWIPDIRNPAEDPLDMSEEGEEDYNGDSGIPALTSVPQPLILHPEVKGGSETTLSPSSEIPIAVGKPRIEDPQSWNSIPKSFSPWSGIQNRQSSDLSIAEGPDSRPLVWDKGQGVGGFITSGSGIDDAMVVPNSDDGLIRMSVEESKPSESMARISGSKAVDQKPSAKIQDPGMADQGRRFVVHSYDEDVSGSQVRVPQYQIPEIQMPSVVDPRSLGSISDPGIAGYAQRDEASSPLVDERDVGIPGHQDRGEDFGAKVLPVIDEEVIDVGSDPKPISNIKPQVQGIQMPSVVDSMFPASISDPGITDYDHLGGTSTPLIDGRDVGFLNHMDKIHDGARGRLVEGRIDLGAEVPPARSLEPGIDEVMVVPNSDDVLIRMSSEEGRSSGSMPHISGGKVVDQKPMVDQGRGFVVHSGDEDVSGSQVRVPRYQVQGIQRHPVIDSQSSGVLSKNREPDLQVANSDIHPLIQDNKEGVSQSPFSDPQPVIHSANPVSYAFPKPDGKTLPFSSPYRWQEIHEVIERISNVISVVRGTSRRISRIELDISQEEWGKARVRLWTAGDRIFGIVEASDPKFKAILDFELPILKENLARSGVDIEFIAEGAGYRPDGWQMPEQREDMVWTRDPGGSWFGIQEASPEGGWSLDGHGSGHIDLWA